MIEIQARQSVFINLPAGDIFACLSDLEKMTGWSSALISIEKTTPDTLRPGAIVQCTIRFLGKWLDMLLEIVEYEPNRCLSFKSLSGCVPCLFCYQFEPVAGGGTVVSEEAMIDLIEEPGDLMEPVITSALRRQLEYDLLTLRDVLEARAAMCEI